MAYNCRLSARRAECSSAGVFTSAGVSIGYFRFWEHIFIGLVVEWLRRSVSMLGVPSSTPGLSAFEVALGVWSWVRVREDRLIGLGWGKTD